MNKLREFRNEMFPPKLEFGCEVRHKVYGNVSQITAKKGSEFKLNYSDSVWDKEDFEILGKPVTLAEVLMMCERELHLINDSTDNFASVCSNSDNGLKELFRVDLTIEPESWPDEIQEKIVGLITGEKL